MKKRYVNPETKIIKVQPQLMTTTSMIINGETDKVESRSGGGFFDDDDWDED